MIGPAGPPDSPHGIHCDPPIDALLPRCRCTCSAGMCRPRSSDKPHTRARLHHAQRRFFLNAASARMHACRMRSGLGGLVDCFTAQSAHPSSSGIANIATGCFGSSAASSSTSSSTCTRSCAQHAAHARPACGLERCVVELQGIGGDGILVAAPDTCMDPVGVQHQAVIWCCAGGLRVARAGIRSLSGFLMPKLSGPTNQHWYIASSSTCWRRS